MPIWSGTQNMQLGGVQVIDPPADDAASLAAPLGTTHHQARL
jgi:hypothetical protein